MSAARGLMREYGDADFQMAEVAERCQLSKGSLYYYFSDRDELLDAVFDESVEDLRRDLEVGTGCAMTAYEALRSSYIELSHHLQVDASLSLAMLYELAGKDPRVGFAHASRFDAVIKAIADQLERAKAEGVVREEVDCGLAAVFVLGAFLTTSLVEAEEGAWGNADTLFRDIAGLMMHGVCTEETQIA